MQDLAAECLLMSQRMDCPARRALLALLKQNNIRPRREHLVGTQEQMMELILGSLGVGLAGEQTPLPACVVSRPLMPDPEPRGIMLAVTAGRPLGPTAGLFIKQMRTRTWPQLVLTGTSVPK